MALNALTKLGPNSLPPKLSVDELNVAGITTSGSAVVTGVTTSGAFHGNLVGSVTGGNIAGNAAGLYGNPDINVGTVVASGSITAPLIGNVTGDLTGNVTGNVSGTATGLSGTPNITVGTITGNLNGDVTGDVTGNLTGVASSATALIDAANILTGNISPARIPTLNQSSSGTSAGLTGVPSIAITNLTGVAATFTGSVSVGGTLTYDDVTNIDSVGLITARSGIKVTAGSITIGSNSDLQIYHNPSTNHSYIDETGSGNLYIRNGSKNSIWCQTDGQVNLYHNDVKKFETSESGVIVSGVCTATSFVGSGANLTDLPAGGNSFEAIADGALVSNKPVMLLADGKVAHVAETITTLSDPELGAHRNLYQNDSNECQITHLGGNDYFTTYVNGNQGDSAYGRIVIHNEDTNSFNYGAQVRISPTINNNPRACYISAVWDSNVSKILCVWAQGPGNDRGIYYAVGTRDNSNGTTWTSRINLESEQNDSNTFSQINSAFDPDTNRCTIIFQQNGSHNTYSRTAQIASDGTVTWGSRQTINSETGYDLYGTDLVYDTSIDRYVACYGYKDGDNGGQHIMEFRVGTANGNSVTWGTALQAIQNSSSTIHQGPKMALDPDTGSICVVTQETDSRDIYSWTLAPVGGSANIVSLRDTYPRVIRSNVDVGIFGVAYDTTTNRMCVIYKDSSNGNRPTAQIGTFTENYSGNLDKYVWGTHVQLNTDSMSGSNNFSVGNQGNDEKSQNVVALPTGGRVIMFYKATSQNVITANLSNSSTNLTNDQHYVGFPDASYVDGATANIKTHGNVATGLSGLTVYSSYYVLNTGELSLTPWGQLSCLLGRAVATDKLQINVNYI